MSVETDLEEADSFKGDSDSKPKSSASVLAALRKAEDAFRPWQTTCDLIDRVYNKDGYLDGFGPDWGSWKDSELDLFWASFEILKPAVYSRPPQPVVAPLFKDGEAIMNVTAEMLERCAVSVFKRTGIDDVMLGARDDLIFAGRGPLWVRHEVEKGKHAVCVEHKDRLDFLHEPARKWSEVGWAAGAAWLTRKEMKARFRKVSGDAYQRAQYTLYRGRDDGDNDRDLEKRAATRKAKVWEVWHKADSRVYWVTDGCDVFLDEGEPHLELSGFFPCPKPAYATLRRRSLIPVPDWERYAVHFRKISELTRRIYSLLDAVKMKGIVAGGGDVGDAIEAVLKDDSDEIIIPVPGAALLAQGATPLVVWLPLAEIATAIQGLIEARGQLIQDFYQLSGISDIMRGATDAEETLGAQELKSQYGSVRVREKSCELQRVAADAVKIAAEIIAEKFPQDQMLEMSGMTIPTRAELEKKVADLTAAARKELHALGENAKQAATQQAQQPQQPQQGGQGQQIDPAQAQQAFEAAQQQIMAKYAPQLAQIEEQVPIEDVMKLLRDDRARGFAFEIESSSTILTDELAEKRTRNEFMAEFTNSAQSLQFLISMGEPGAKLAGAMLKFVLAPYRAGRELDGAIDEFIDAAPEMAAKAAAASGESDDLAAANKMLGEAEMAKARAQTMKVEADAKNDQAEMQRRMFEMQQKAAADQAKAAAEMEKLRQSAAAHEANFSKLAAEIDQIRATTYKTLVDAGIAQSQHALDQFRTVADVQARESDQQMQQVEMAQGAEDRATENDFRERGEERADRQQDLTERTAMNGGDSA
jgi:hypothetical protein